MSKPDVIILCGGKGTRLAPIIGDRTPKCLAPVNGKPFLEYLIEKIPEDSRIILATGHLHQAVWSWLRYRKKSPHFIDAPYCGEDGVYPSVRRAVQHCTSESVLLMNGDTIFDGHLPPHTDGSFCIRGIPSGIQRAPKLYIGLPQPMMDCTGWFTFLDIGTPEGYAKAQEILK